MSKIPPEEIQYIQYQLLALNNSSSISVYVFAKYTNTKIINGVSVEAINLPFGFSTTWDWLHDLSFEEEDY